MKNMKITTLVMLTMGAFFLGGCPAKEKGPLEKAGESADEIVKDAGDAADEAADDASKAAEDLKSDK
jgi:hypothetical protein